MHDAECAISVTALPHASASTSAALGNAHGEVWQVKDAKDPNEHAAAAVLAVCPVSPATVHNAERNLGDPTTASPYNRVGYAW